MSAMTLSNPVAAPLSLANPVWCGLCREWRVGPLTNWSVCRRCTRRQRLPSAESMQARAAARDEARYLAIERGD